MKIHSNFNLFAATNFDPSKYIESPSYGVNRFMLDRIGNEKARATTIVQYQPNSKFPKHTHIGGEEFLVLSGTFKDQYGEFPAGTYVRNPIGSEHAPWVDDDGCTIMVKLLQMCDPTITNEDTTPLHVFYDDDDNDKESGIQQQQSTEYGKVLEMYKNDRTGERVQMCWIDDDKSFPATDEGIIGGEELFVVDGSLTLDNNNKNNGDKSDEVEYRKWGWLRFPAAAATTGNQQPTPRVLRSGKQGAQVYRKVGHLTQKALSMEKIQITDDD